MVPQQHANADRPSHHQVARLQTSGTFSGRARQLERHLGITASLSLQQGRDAAWLRQLSRRDGTARARTARREQKKCRQNGLEGLAHSNNAARDTNQTKGTESN